MSIVCRVLKISRSSYYYALDHAQRSLYSKEEQEAVEKMFYKHHGSFGRRPIKRELEKIGIKMSEQKVSSILKELGLRSKYGRRRIKNVYTHKEVSKKYISENLYRKLEEKKSKTIWSMDFTETKVSGKKIYACGIISVNSKILVGYKQGKRMTSKLAKETLEEAMKRYGKPYMILTDRGSQFTSNAFYDTLKQNDIISSMSRPHTPIDNVYIETFWKSMKTEIGKTGHLTEENYKLVCDYYVYYYNNIRPHSSLDYYPPIEYSKKRELIDYSNSVTKINV